MAKVKTIVTLETIRSTVDGKNWIDGTELDLSIHPVEQEDGLVACVTLPKSDFDKTFTLTEMRALLAALENADRLLGE